MKKRVKTREINEIEYKTVIEAKQQERFLEQTNKLVNN